jgi:two-component system OmpR family sensor kinase
MLARIERGVESQRRFTTDASHELRSPLSRLRAELEVTLRRPREAGEYEEALHSSLDEVQRLSQLTEDLLTLARLEADEPGRRPDSVLLSSVVDEAIGRLRAQAERRKVDLVREGAPLVAARATTTTVALALTNIIDNALKFSPAGSTVRVGLTAQGSEAVISVSDMGPGISAHEVPRIFDRFHRGKAAQGIDAPGFGLGLAISRAAVERHGGRIAAESRPGGGTTFSIRLPLAG